MIFFESWKELYRVAVSALLIYPFIVFAVKVAGKRSTSKMNNFDWIVTVAMGAITGSAILAEEVTLSEAFVAITILLGLQYAATKATVYLPEVAKIIHSAPTLLYYEGVFQEDAMICERVSRGEIERAVREQGYNDLTEVGAVVMESNATLSVLGKTTGRTALLDKVRP